MPRLAATAFTVAPASIAPGATLTIRYRIAGRPRRVRVRIDLLPEAGGKPAATLHLGRLRTGRDLTASWRPKLAPGRYTARLRATTLKRGRRARASRRSTLEIVAPPVTASTGVFPVQGAYTLGDEQARFGAGRTGHRHQGQDILAAAGTPVVSPRAGFVAWRAFQKGGAGHYLVVRGDDLRDYVFMHLLDGSVAVQKGQARRRRTAARRRRLHGPLDRAAPALRDLAGRLVHEQGLAADRPAAGSARLGGR